jgi:hypothetical protein
MSTIEQAKPTTNQVQQWHELAQQLRVDSIRSTTAAICATILAIPRTPTTTI